MARRPRFGNEETEKSAIAFGKAVLRARKELGLSQVELARIVGCMQPNLKQIEAIGASPKSKVFMPLCEQLGLDPYEFGFKDVHLEIINRWIEEHSGNC